MLHTPPPPSISMSCHSMLPSLPGSWPLARSVPSKGLNASALVPIGKSDFSGECLQLKGFLKSGQCCFKTPTGGHGRNMIVNTQEPGLIEVQERSNGSALFRFGMRDSHDKSEDHVFPREYSRRTTSLSGSTEVSRVSDWSATGLRKWEVLEGPSDDKTVEMGRNFIANHSTCKDSDVLLPSYSLANHTKCRHLQKKNISSSGRTGRVDKDASFNEPLGHLQNPSFNHDPILISDLSETLNQGFTIEPTTNYHDLNRQLGLPSSFAKVHKLARASGCSTLGVYKNMLSTVLRREFIQPGYVESMKWQQGPMDPPYFHAATMMMTIRRSPTELIATENYAEAAPTHVKCPTKSLTTKRCQLEEVRKKNVCRPRKSGRTASHSRDLFKRSPFQLYKVIFCYPFMNSNSAALNLQTISRDSLQEIVVVFNQIAVGLAGGGIALVLFVASRMLSVNATLDSGKVASLVYGVGLIWLSSAVQRLGGVVRSMAHACTKAKLQRKEHLEHLRRELQALTFKAFTLIALSVVRLA